MRERVGLAHRQREWVVRSNSAAPACPGSDSALLEAAQRCGSRQSRFSSADRRHKKAGVVVVGKNSLLKVKNTLNHKVLLKKGQNPRALCGMCLQEAPLGNHAGLFWPLHLSWDDKHEGKKTKSFVLPLETKVKLSWAQVPIKMSNATNSSQRICPLFVQLYPCQGKEEDTLTFVFGEQRRQQSQQAWYTFLLLDQTSQQGH